MQFFEFVQIPGKSLDSLGNRALELCAFIVFSLQAFGFIFSDLNVNDLLKLTEYKFCDTFSSEEQSLTQTLIPIKKCDLLEVSKICYSYTWNQSKFKAQPSKINQIIFIRNMNLLSY